MLVRRCCCCCNLKFGFLTYGIICLILKFSVITELYLHYRALYSYSDAYSIPLYSNGYLLSLSVASLLALFLALKGIVQKKSILMYPYIVILTLEILTFLVYVMIFAIFWLPGIIAGIFSIIICFHIYILICLISLYKDTQKEEERKSSKDNSLGYI